MGREFGGWKSHRLCCLPTIPFGIVAASLLDCWFTSLLDRTGWLEQGI